jgi:hypothetical protein
LLTDAGEVQPSPYFCWFVYPSFVL